MKENKMSYIKINKLIWVMGLPMILSMVLQAIYNVVDTIFVINSSAGTLGNAALTAAFPIQILIIAIGVGTGVGINAMLSKSLGEGDKKTVAKVAGNGIFIALVIYLLFLIFGSFFAKGYMQIMSNNQTVIDYGTTYLRICCCFSIGSVGYTVFERFLQATGKTTYSMIAQISGALCNIILDAVFIFGFDMGVLGAAVATVIGQFLSLFVAMFLHYFKNKEIDGSIKHIKPSLRIIKTIYKIGLPAAIMQALLAVMMFVILLVIKTISNEATMSLLTNTYGIYYKIMQMALFACFGLSNTLITIVSFNHGMSNKQRVNDTVKWGIIDSIIAALVITLLFQILATPISNLFGLSLPKVSEDGILKEDVINGCKMALHISTIGYVFMGISVGIQGILQGLRNVYKPVIISLLRLIIFVIPFAYLFCHSNNANDLFWWTFPIAEVLTSIISYPLLKDSIKRLDYSEEVFVGSIITVSRRHGSGGKEIAKRLAEKLGFKYFDKENYVSEKDQYTYEKYQSKNINFEAISATAKQIEEVAKDGNVVICGRAADYFLRNKKIISIFIDASDEYRIKRISQNYNDSLELAKKNMKKSDESRSQYYLKISGQIFGDKNNYTITIDSSDGIEETTTKLLKQIKELL